MRLVGIPNVLETYRGDSEESTLYLEYTDRYGGKWWLTELAGTESVTLASAESMGDLVRYVRHRLKQDVTWKFFGDFDKAVYLSGNYGWHNNYSVVWLAYEWGMDLDSAEKSLLRAYQNSHGEKFSYETESNYISIDELVDRATDYLQSVTEEGLAWEWDAGELSLVDVTDTEEYQMWNGE